MGDLDDALTAVEADVDVAMRGAQVVVRELKKAKASAAAGQLRDLQSALEDVERLVAQLLSATRAARTGWAIDQQTYFASGRYTQELLDLAEKASLTIFLEDDRLLCYPSVVRVLAADQTVEIDKKKHRGVRPSHILAVLRAGQARQPRFKPAVFLETLLNAYDLVIAKEGRGVGATVGLVDVYGVLTLLPGQSREYTKHEFARDLYLLDQSGETLTKNGREIRLPASTMTKGRDVLTTVTKAGQQKIYAGIAFS